MYLSEAEVRLSSVSCHFEVFGALGAVIIQIDLTARMSGRASMEHGPDGLFSPELTYSPAMRMCRR